MIISLIVAMDQNRGIGYQGQLPWHLSSDLRRFRTLTMGHHLLMGRKTYTSIGKPLPGRVMIVVSKNPDFQVDGCEIVHSLDKGLRFARESGEEELFIIGGGKIFSQSLPFADRLYLTIVHTASKVDVYFPEINSSDWIEISSLDHSSGPGDDYSHTYKLIHRRVMPADVV